MKLSKILIIYYSSTGHIRKMAEAVEAGVIEAGAEADLLNVTECTVDQLLDYDGIIAGSPAYFGVLASQLKDFFDRSIKHYGKLEGKVGAAFTSEGILGGGAETTVLSILQMMLVHGMIIQGQIRGSHYGAVSISEPDETVLQRCRQLGQKTAELTAKLHG